MMNRLAINTIVRATRVNPSIRSVAPYRWQSSKPAANQGGSGSNLTAGLAGGLTVLLGGFAWYHFSGTRQLVNTAQEGIKKAQELKETVKDKAGDSNETLKYLRSASATLIPGSAPFLGKVFDQIEEISNEHGDEVKKIFEETYNDFEKLSKEGVFNSKTPSKAVEILQKRVQQIQDLGGDAFNKLISENPNLQDKLSDQYNNLKDVAKKAKEKKPEAQKLLKETGSELANIFKDGDFGKKNIQKAQDLLKKKGEEAKKLVEDVQKK
jgi:hypothetical protein